jgi:hypothetical protein
MKVAGFPFCLSPLFPLRAPSRVDPSGLGHAATIYSSVQGPPGVETPTLTFAQKPLNFYFFTNLVPGNGVLARRPSANWNSP